MAKKKPAPQPEPERVHMGNVLRQSLISLGYAEPPRVSLQRVMAEIERRTGKKISKQRLYNILESPDVSPNTLRLLADGLGVSGLELLSGKREKKSPESS